MSEVLTADETKKTLECCTKFHHDCLKCPSYIGKGTVGCVDRVKNGALDLINRQKAELDKLAEEYGELIIEKDELFDIAEEQKAELEQLKIENRILSQKRISFPERLEIDRKARAEAVKEFVERLKEHKIDVDVSFGYGKEVYTEAVAVIEIDNLVKEMVGENNG